VQISPAAQSRLPHANGAPASHDALQVQTPLFWSHCALQTQFVGQLHGGGGALHVVGGGPLQQSHPLPVQRAGPQLGGQVGGGVRHAPPDEEPLLDEELLLEELEELEPLDDPPLEELAGGPVSGVTAPPQATRTTTTTAAKTRPERMPPRKHRPCPHDSLEKRLHVQPRCAT
jgi:hypothetical protein